MRNRTSPILCLLLPALAAHAQYVGKVGQGEERKPTLRATAVYEYTGSMTAPSASRLVPVVVWDGTNYQPGGLYLAQPEPLAVAPGTQYVLEQSGVPAGLFNLGGAGQLNGSWVGLGRYAPNIAPPAPRKLAASRKPPAITGGSGRGRATAAGSDDTGGGPVLHRKADSDAGSSPSGTAGGGGASQDSGNGPTLHRRDSSTTDSGTATSPTGSTTTPGSTSSTGAPDDDRPVLHRKEDGSATPSGTGQTSGSPGASTTGSSTSPGPSGSSPSGSSTGGSSTGGSSTGGSSTGGSSTPNDNGPTLHRKSDTADTGGTTPSPDPDRPTLHRTDTAASAPAPDADRPTLHRHAEGSLDTAAIDPDRPHLRYGVPAEAAARVLPTELKETPGTPGAAISQTVAISDVSTDEPHPFRYTWPSADAQAQAEAAMHALAVRALATAARATFGPAAQSAARTDASLQQAAAAAQPPAGAAARPRHAAGKPAAAAPDPLADPQFNAFELSYGGGATYVYSAHTPATGADRRYVTLIAQPDFYGRPQVVFSQTTRGGMLAENPALHLIDAVDADGDHRAELLFDAQSALAPSQGSRQFVLYSVVSGRANQVFATTVGAQ